MASLSEEELLHFLAAEGGKAKNSELLSRYRDFVNHGDPQIRAQHRETFKDIINKVAVVKQEDGEKYVILKKKYQFLITSMGNADKHGTTVGPLPDHPMSMMLPENQLPDTVSKHVVSKLEEGSYGSSVGEALRNTSESVLHAPPPKIHVTDFSAVSQPDPSTQVGYAAWDSLPELHVGSLSSLEDKVESPEVGSEEVPAEPEEDEADPITKDEPEHEALEDGGSSVGPTAIALDPIEKEWLQGAASGNVPTLSHLLKQEPSLALKKDFTSGTALHWAAKHGKMDMTVLLVKAGADVNTRAGGYTPLHIAALHGHRQIMELLILDYGAKQTVRDYSGRLPAQYLKLEGHSNGATGSPRLELQMLLEFQQLRGERRNRKLACLFLPKSSSSHSKKRWGSAEDLTEEEEEKGNGSSQHLALPSPYRVRKFSR
ncbi:ankyrin repeat domain-containing protein SOWAHB-like isoform X1 [Rhinatrema bivittatum]|uniref:ankyrin repeat domain-containing protein SOWAHB-like isoform X1 n=1 Tax=Rhinatrema bivittatum TaxID=194408 RepID=UPI00112AEB2A|nr:ankyrin repeat domain-containing protein SOWAHB-like isoform X1 [Rhinatrema bivittatum]